jgi:hypothetical protein
MYSLEDRNYYNDARVQAIRAVVPTDEEGNELPHKWVVCPLCEGRGKHANPSIDCCGLTAEDFDTDPDFAEAYMSGAYDVECRHCGGRTTVPEVVVSRCTFAQKRILVLMRRQERDRIDSRYEY